MYSMYIKLYDVRMLVVCMHLASTQMFFNIKIQNHHKTAHNNNSETQHAVTKTSIKGSKHHRSQRMSNIQAANPQQARNQFQTQVRTSFGTAQLLRFVCACLTFPSCLPPGSSGRAGSPYVGAWQSSVWSWTCSSAPWQSLGRPHLMWSERESTMEALFTHQRTLQSGLCIYFKLFCLYLHI